MSFMPGNNKVRPFRADSEVDEEFDGVVDNRQCRDVLCCILFLAFWCGMGYVAFVSFTHGQPERLIFGVDSYGNVCGQENEDIPGVQLSGLNMKDKRYLFYFEDTALTGSIDSKKLCVAACPNDTISTMEELEAYADIGLSYCSYEVENFTDITFGDIDDCPDLPISPSDGVLYRCFPSSIIGEASKLINTEWFKKALADIKSSWREICYLCAISIGLAIVMMVVLRFFAGVVIWFMVVFFIMGSIGGSGYLWYQWFLRKRDLDEIPVEEQLDSDKQNVKTMLIYASVTSGVTVILLLLLFVMRKRIALVVALFKESGKAIGAIPLLLLQPFWTFLALAILTCYWIAVFLYLTTSGEPVAQEDGRVEYQQEKIIEYMWWYHLFGLFWGSQFMIACQQFVIASAISIWFFTRDKSTLGWPILRSVGRVLRYHLGSIAFGSLLIALVMFARFVLGYIQSKLKGSQNELLKYILKCLQCCLWCFEKVLKFINRNAYIEIAIHGYSFCKAAKEAFAVLISNALRVAAINSVGDFLLFLGKVAVAASVVVIGLEFLQDDPDVNYYAVPIALAAIFALLISHIFLSVYEMAIDTLFLCFCEDCKANDGIVKPYYMSKNLMKFVENAAKARAALEKRERVVLT
ncbi:choline transporter-like protein 1 [Antedon mediterranea]|uniref:choline transporter-like protein 1 n=1 Tax=Antedon mediterranea TaxID=105859 RepID=UPI003AF77354